MTNRNASDMHLSKPVLTSRLRISSAHCLQNNLACSALEQQNVSYVSKRIGKPNCFMHDRSECCTRHIFAPEWHKLHGLRNEGLAHSARDLIARVARCAMIVCRHFGLGGFTGCACRSHSSRTACVCLANGPKIATRILTLCDQPQRK